MAIALALPLAGCGEGSALSGVSMKIGACEVEAVQTLANPYYAGTGQDADLLFFATTYIHACMRASGFVFESQRCAGPDKTRDATCYRFDGRVSTWLGTIF